MDAQALLMVGDGAVSDALGAMAELLGWTATVVDTLADARAALPHVQAVVVTSHDAEVDAPVLAAAIGLGPGGPAYLGAMGSRPTQARRREWLLAQGLTPEQLASVHGPAGLDIGAVDPAEIALSILAEMVAVRRGAEVQGALRDRTGPIHAQADVT